MWDNALGGKAKRTVCGAYATPPSSNAKPCLPENTDGMLTNGSDGLFGQFCHPNDAFRNTQPRCEIVGQTHSEVFAVGYLREPMRRFHRCCQPTRLVNDGKEQGQEEKRPEDPFNWYENVD